MEIFNLIEASIQNARQSFWPALAPEILLALTIMVILIVRCFTWGTVLQKVDAFVLTLAGCSIALYYALPAQANAAAQVQNGLFNGMLELDSFAIYIRVLLLAFTILFAIFTWLTNTPDRDDGADFYCLVLGGVLGMCFMASANHLLMVFMAVEMASIPSYALSGMLRNRRDSSEAALKYSVYGAGAAGIMLYGISLLAGVFNTVHLPTMAQTMAVRLPELNSAEQLVVALGGLMVMAGVAFKLSAVPFHFWCPDVFTGASAEVNAFLSVASKAAALALLVRLAVGLGTLDPATPAVTAAARPASVAAADAAPTVYVAQAAENADAAHADAAQSAPASQAAATGDPLSGVRYFLAALIGGIAAVSCTFGNLAAYGQSNIKRMMAYSTIAHAGYMMLPVPAALLLAGSQPAEARAAIASLAFYLFIYLFMNLGAFALIAFLRGSLGTEQIADYGGLVRKSPIVVVLFSIVLFSLVGLPPLAGFTGKMLVFASLANGYQATGQRLLLALLVIGGINTALSLYYYLRVVKVMTIDPESEVVRSSGSTLGFLRGVYAAAIVIPILVFGIFWEQINQIAGAAARGLF